MNKKFRWECLGCLHKWKGNPKCPVCGGSSKVIVDPHIYIKREK